MKNHMKVHTDKKSKVAFWCEKCKQVRKCWDGELGDYSNPIMKSTPFLRPVNRGTIDFHQFKFSSHYKPGYGLANVCPTACVWTFGQIMNNIVPALSHIIDREAREIVCLVASVCLPVCLSVCLSVCALLLEPFDR